MALETRATQVPGPTRPSGPPSTAPSGARPASPPGPRLLAWVTALAVKAGRLFGHAIGICLRAVVYVVASPVILLADLVQPDPHFDRSWIAGFMACVTVTIFITWGFGYLVTAETLQGNSLITGYVEIGPRLAAVPYLNEIQITAAEKGLDPALVAAIVSQESGFDPEAVSRAGAKGLMQILPSTWRLLRPDSPCKGNHSPPACGEDCIYDPEANIRAGTAYFADILSQFDGNIILAFAAYNAGTAAVQHAQVTQASADGSPPEGLESLPPFAETRAYVKRVLSFWVVLRNGTVPDVATLSVEECRLLRQMATILPAVVFGLWTLFAVWIARRMKSGPRP